MLSKQEYLTATEQLNALVCKPAPDGKAYSVSGYTSDEIWWTLGFGYINSETPWVQVWWEARHLIGDYLAQESKEVNDLLGESANDTDSQALANAINELLEFTQRKAASLAKESVQKDPIIEMNGKRYKLVEIV